MGLVAKGRLEQHRLLDHVGRVRREVPTPAVASCRFGVDQSGKIRPGGDLIYSTTNEHFAVTASTELPNWGHIAQMAINIADSDRSWAFMKNGHAAAYKQLPIGPTHAKYAVVDIRRRWI